MDQKLLLNVERETERKKGEKEERKKRQGRNEKRRNRVGYYYQKYAYFPFFFISLMPACQGGMDT